jgi:methyl coenzyme M reductase subunit C
MAEISMRRLMGLTGLTRRELEVIDEATLASLALGEVNEQVVWRVRRVRRLRRDLGLDYASIEIIVRLLDRVEELERRQV